MSANSITLQHAVTITQLTGELYLVNADGSRTQLAEGDVVPQGAVIATQGGGSFMGQGELFTLPPADDARLVGEPDDEGVALAQLQTGDLPDEISALQQAILGGVDPTQTFEAAAGGAPAAGGGIGGVVGSSGNGGFVTIDRTGNATIAEASFDTTYNAVMAAPLRAQPSEEEPRLSSETTSANLALSAAKEVNEGGEITFVATLDRAVVGEDMVITLSNGAIITIPVGQTSGSVTVPAPADDPYLDQAQVNVTVTGTLGGGFEQVVTGPGTTTQVNDTLDPTTVTLIAPTEVNEGRAITYSAVVNNPPQSDLVLTLSNGATLTILAGQLSGSVTIDAPSDDVYRDDSSLTVEIVTSQGGNYEQLNIGNSVTTTITTTITDTLDTTTVTLSSTTNGQTVVEGGSIIYTASVSSPVTGSPLVITLTDGTRITIPVGSSSANSEPVPVRGDDAYRQGDTAVSVNIDDARGGNYEKIAINGTVSHTVVDDNDAPTLTLSGSKEVFEGQSATYTLTISEAPKTDMTVRVVIGHKTTDSGDVEAQELTLVIKAGQNSVTFPVQTLDDQLTERPEQYTVTVVGTVGGGYERAPTLPSITTTIVDDRNTSPGGNPEVDEDTTATLSISAGGDVREANDSYLSYSVKLTNAVSHDVALKLLLGQGSDSATKGSDYQDALYVADGKGGYRLATEADFKIAAGQTELKLFVKVVDDALTEGRETVTLGVSSGSDKLTNPNTNLGATGGIVDDRNTSPGGNPEVDEDITATLSISAGGDVREANDSYLSYSVKLTNAVSHDVALKLLLGQGSDSATKGSDYQDALYVADGKGGYRLATEADFKIAAGQTELKLFVKVVDDALTEGRETVTLGVSSGSDKLTNPNTNLGATGGIVDDRNTSPGGNPEVDEDTTATLSISAGGDVREANDSYLSYSVKLTNAVSHDVALKLLLGQGSDSATKGSDYQDALYVADGKGGYRLATEADFKIAAGQTELKLFVKVVDDALTEGRETVTLGVSSGSDKLTNPNTNLGATGGIVDDRNTSPGGNPEVDEDITATLSISAGGDVREANDSYLSYSVKLTNAVSHDVALKLLLGQGSDSATKGSDYQDALYVADGKGGYRLATEADFKIAAGQTELKLFVKVVDDALTEGRETVTLGVSSGSDKLTNPNTNLGATGGIVDDRNTSPGGNPEVDEDTTATLSISAGGDVREANDSYLSYSVKLTNAVSHDVALKLLLGQGSDSATKGSDYQDALYVADGKGGYRLATEADFKIAAGQTELKLFVKVVDDALTEGRETVTLGVSSGSDKLTNPNTNLGATGGIVDDRNTSQGGNPEVDEDTTATVIVNDAGQVREVDGAYLTYEVKLSAPVASDTQVTLSLSGSATLDSDYSKLEYLNNKGEWVAVPADGKITLPAKGEVISVRVEVLDDAVTENNETVVLTATPVGNPQVSGSGSGTGTIVDDRNTTLGGNPDVDEDTVAAVVVSDAGEVREASGAYLVYEVKLSNAVAHDTNVILSQGGSASHGSDYSTMEYSTGNGQWLTVPASGLITLPAHGTAIQVRVAVLDDAQTELNESVILTATPVGNPQVTTADSGQGTIVDDRTQAPGGNTSVDEDTSAQVVVNDAGQVREAAGAYLTYELKLSTPVASDTTVVLSLSGTATKGSDYQAFEYRNSSGQWVTVPANGQIILPASAAAVLVRVAVLDDALTENSETVVLTATPVGNPLVSGPDSGTGTILDDRVTTGGNPNVDEDTPATVIVSDAGEVREGSGLYLTYEVKLSNPIATDTDVTLSLSGSASSGSDYSSLQYLNSSGQWVAVPINGQLTLPATGAPIKVRVPVLDDTSAEDNETVILTATPTGNRLVTGADSGSGIIVDNDLAVRLTGGLVDEDGLVGGNASLPEPVGSPTEGPLSVSQALQVTDGKGNSVSGAQLKLLGIVGLSGVTGTLGEPLYVVQDGAGLKGYLGSNTAANTAFTITVDNTANPPSYTFTLLKPLSHVVDGQSQTLTSQDELRFTVNYQVNKSEFATANGSFDLAIRDDVPVAKADDNQVDVLVDSFKVSGVEANWTEWSGGENTVNRSDSADNDEGLDQLRWGGGDKQSGYGFMDNDSALKGLIPINEEIKLGVFTHYNYPIKSGTSISAATMKVTFSVIDASGVITPVTLTINFDHNETSNSGADPRDIITIGETTATFNFLGKFYTLSVLGFRDASGTLVKSIYTDENATNNFDLVVKMTEGSGYALPKATGNVLANDLAGADGGLSVIGYGVGSSNATYTNGAGTSIAGLYGVLTIMANGAYTYQVTKNGSQIPADARETFTYSVRDGDGDTTNSVLTINVNAFNHHGAPAHLPLTVEGTDLNDTMVVRHGEKAGNPDQLDVFFGGNLLGSIIDDKGNTTSVHTGVCFNKGNSGQTVSSGAGNDHVETGSGDDVIYAGMTGTPQFGTDDALQLTVAELSAHHIMIGNLSGSDAMLDADGLLLSVDVSSRYADVVNSGSGNDKIYGQSGSDILFGHTGDDYINGGSHNDALRGGLGNDILIGGLGHDVMRGDGGADTFVWNKGDTTAGTLSKDYIMDFNMEMGSLKQAQGDTLDLRDLLDHDSSGRENDLKGLLSVFQDKDGVHLQVKESSTASVSQEIILLNHSFDSLTGHSGATASQVIDQMLSTNMLEIDK